MVHIGGFFMGLKKSHRISNFLLHQIACFCGQYIKKKPLKCLYFSGFHDFSFCKSGAGRKPSSVITVTACIFAMPSVKKRSVVITHSDSGSGKA